MSVIGIRAHDGGMLAGDHYPAVTDALDGHSVCGHGPDHERSTTYGLRPEIRTRMSARSRRPRPCVVMAHGVGATRDCGLDEFARAGAAFLHRVFANTKALAVTA
jgi:uncharacterized protein